MKNDELKKPKDIEAELNLLQNKLKDAEKDQKSVQSFLKEGKIGEVYALSGKNKKQ